MRKIFYLLLFLSVSSCNTNNKNTYLFNNKVHIYIPSEMTELSPKEICNFYGEIEHYSLKGKSIIPNNVFSYKLDSSNFEEIAVYYSKDTLMNHKLFLERKLKDEVQYLRNVYKEINFLQKRVTNNQLYLEYTLQGKNSNSRFFNYCVMINNKLIELTYLSTDHKKLNIHLKKIQKSLE